LRAACGRLAYPVIPPWTAGFGSKHRASLVNPVGGGAGHTGLYSVAMKIAVSIPDPLFEAADRLAAARKTSRSNLYAMALERLLAEEDDSAITDRLDAVYAADAPATERPAPRRVITVRESW
jgi:hypothetical protein